eukprot:TRINITY_DN1780_c0_g1_i1.p1 TRINITY_DN1780_c0_g1~~TRINITY_DN1780_c0_g1_i1.p1  ORF type:complete len:368 (-),score=105.69 TRINITY_DN1780_c0_g1_i1:61-1164(-)
MVLEATMICLDNSEFMRNGDYIPSRAEAQQDAINLIAAAKTQSNPESSVAVMTSAGKNPEVLVTLTQDLGKILSALHGVHLEGSNNFINALQVAQLALKHRQNKNQHQRVIAFVGTPLKESVEDLVRLAKRLKKNNIAVDVVNFGEETTNTERLETFINTLNTNDNSHLVTVPPGPHILSDILLSSPIVVGEGGGSSFGASAAAAAAVAAQRGGTGGGEYDFGIDPNLDPELALALRLSMEEERARQERSSQEQPATNTDAPSTTAPTTTPSVIAVQDVEMTEEEELQQAIQLSMAAEAAAKNAASTQDQEMESKNENQGQNVNESLQDQDFLNSVLASLPGVDPNDARIKSVLESMKKPSEKDDKK